MDRLRDLGREFWKFAYHVVREVSANAIVTLIGFGSGLLVDQLLTAPVSSFATLGAVVAFISGVWKA